MEISTFQICDVMQKIYDVIFAREELNQQTRMNSASLRTLRKQNNANSFARIAVNVMS